MGSRLVAQAITYVCPDPKLSPAARTVLLVMCHTAKDADANPVYYAGSAYLARALGYPVTADDEGRESTPTAGRQAIARATRELRKAGYIEQLEGLPRTWKRRWLITMPGLRAVRDVVTPMSRHEVTRESPQR